MLDSFVGSLLLGCYISVTLSVVMALVYSTIGTIEYFTSRPTPSTHPVPLDLKSYVTMNLMDFITDNYENITFVKVDNTMTTVPAETCFMRDYAGPSFNFFHPRYDLSSTTGTISVGDIVLCLQVDDKTHIFGPKSLRHDLAKFTQKN